MTRLINPRLALPVLSLAVLVAAVFWLQPRAMSYVGVNLLFNLAVPIALATVAQMVVIMVGDIDLSMGAFVSLVACITAAILPVNPVLGALMLAGCVLAYAALGALIEARGLPAIVVTLGMSFVWGGAAVLILPSPGGTAPGWLTWVMKAKPPLVPMAIVASVLIAAVAHLVIMRSSFGARLAGVPVARTSAATYVISAVMAPPPSLAMTGKSPAGSTGR